MGAGCFRGLNLDPFEVGKPRTYPLALCEGEGERLQTE